MRTHWTVGWGIFFNEQEAVNDFMNIHPRESMLSTETPKVGDNVSLSEQAALNLHKWLWSVPEFTPVVIKR